MDRLQRGVSYFSIGCNPTEAEVICSHSVNFRTVSTRSTPTASIMEKSSVIPDAVSALGRVIPHEEVGLHPIAGGPAMIYIHFC